MYDLAQRRIIAYELALSGGHVAAAVKRLQEGYETFRGISERTLRRLLNRDDVREMMAQALAEISKASVTGTAARALEGAALGPKLDQILFEVKALRKDFANRKAP